MVDREREALIKALGQRARGLIVGAEETGGTERQLLEHTVGLLFQAAAALRQSPAPAPPEQSSRPDRWRHVCSKCRRHWETDRALATSELCGDCHREVVVPPSERPPSVDREREALEKIKAIGDAVATYDDPDPMISALSEIDEVAAAALRQRYCFYCGAAIDVQGYRPAPPPSTEAK